jgi:putative Mn2+ efflux pump MntP
MTLFPVFLIALGLSMDSFAVALGYGLVSGKPRAKDILKCGLFFGLFQGLMPVIGYFLGINLKAFITGIDHWIAFGLLGIIGGKMIVESFESKKEEKTKNPFKNMPLCYAAIATSIDALAMGIGFAFLQVKIFSAAAIIGIVTLVFAVCGILIGNKIGNILEKKALFSGGIILVGIGTKILLQHLYF